MTPAAAIAMLDRQVAAHGEPITITRGVDTQAARAFVRRAVVDPILPGADAAQAGTMLVLSPTGLDTIAAPARGDLVTIAGRQTFLEEAEPVRMGDTIIRFNLRVKG